MELGFDHHDLLPARQLPGAESAPSARLDWAGLKARFLAAHALRLEIAKAGELEPEGGSFILAGERVLAAAHELSRCVNPSALGKGKDLSAIEDAIPGFPTPAIEE